jgi:hypothetical protein
MAPADGWSLGESSKPPVVPEASKAAGAGHDQCAVMVPFMSGWTSQVNVYVPAARVGTL